MMVLEKEAKLLELEMYYAEMYNKMSNKEKYNTQFKLLKGGYKFCPKCKKIKEKGEFEMVNGKYENVCRKCSNTDERFILKNNKIEEETKKCKVCGKTKMLTDFSNTKVNGKIYYRHTCKECYKNGKGKIFKRTVLKKKCTVCGEYLTLKNFHKNGKDKNGAVKYKSMCKKCNKIHRDKIKETKNITQENNIKNILKDTIINENYIMVNYIDFDDKKIVINESDIKMGVIYNNIIFNDVNEIEKYIKFEKIMKENIGISDNEIIKKMFTNISLFENIF